jgi:ParB/RepB/Spo0J family partition protein
MSTKRKTHVQEFDPWRIRPLPGQPRKRFRGIKELAESIAECGQQSPGIVTLVDGDAEHDAQLVDGERRLRACRIAKTPFRAEVRPAVDAEETFVASFAANFGKQDHDVIEIAEGLDRMKRAGKSMEQLARIAGRSVGWVQQHLNLLKLHADVRAMMIPSETDDDDRPALTFSIAQILVPVEPDQQLALAKRITAGEGMGLASARRFVLRERSEAGDETAYAGRNNRRRSIDVIESILVDLSERIGVYLDMPGSEFRKVIDQADNVTKRNVIKSIEEAAGNLDMLAPVIRERLPKTGRPTAA